MLFWAKTVGDSQPGISVRDHCINVGCVAEAICAQLPESVRRMLPPGAATLAALHDVGKITLGFQAKCGEWVRRSGLVGRDLLEANLSVSDHALVSQAFLHKAVLKGEARLWSVAVGAHHGRPKGRTPPSSASRESRSAWAEDERRLLTEELQSIFGCLPTTGPDSRRAPYHPDLWLLAGLITFADWLGSNEAFFSPEMGEALDVTRVKSRQVLKAISWPGAALRLTGFAAAFAVNDHVAFQANALQRAVLAAVASPGLIVVEGPMGCGKTEAALYAAQQLIATGQQHGIYFALPTQVTSNRIHLRVSQFLKNTLAGDAHVRLAHANAWLVNDFDLHLRPAVARDQEDAEEHVREARSWFASSKQALLAPYGVGTVDQALLGVVAVKHFFLRRFALAGKVVILDEIHSYDIYTGTLITALVRELLQLRCTVIILSATLTAARRKELLEAAGLTEGTPPGDYPLVSSGAGPGEARHIMPEWVQRKRVGLRVGCISEDETAEALVERAERGQHVLWIRNTVIEAQQSYRDICSRVREGGARPGLLHSRFPFQRREALENEWLVRLGRERAEGQGSILIATQVVEQSVDIDLDFMVSDLAPTDMLLQRLGRLWRHARLSRRAEEPEFWIRIPAFVAESTARELKKSLGRSARVYAPYVLLRSACVFMNRKVIDLPADIRPVLEATYADPEANEPAGWTELYGELQKEKAALSAFAEAATRVLGNPMVLDDEGVLTRRQGSPTVLTILLRNVTRLADSRWRLTALDGVTVEVSDYEWRMDAARFLNRWMVRVPGWMIPDHAPLPRWLDLHVSGRATYVLVRPDDGCCLFDEKERRVTYSECLGIFAESAARPATQWNDDDEFDG
jgi:CRISPR-associated endonuclease/helicase Cas3